MSKATTPTTLPPLTPHTLLERFPDLPTWAIHAFHEIYNAVQKQQYRLSPETLALLNIAVLPMAGYKYDGDRGPMLDCSVSVRQLFVDETSYGHGREHVVLARLGTEIERLWRGE
jgi:hypothetical protein